MLIIFTDIDGTLIDANTYSFEASLPAVRRLQELEIPIVPCTSKTRSEVETLRSKLGITDPFIVENGAAVYVPADYFASWLGFEECACGYKIIHLDTPYDILRRILVEAREAADCRVVGFGDMTAEEVAEDSGLSVHDAALAKAREYDESFRIFGDEGQKRRVLGHITASGLNYTSGSRYYHIMGDNDKGKAVSLLMRLYRSNFEGTPIESVGLGDSLNDLPMLEAVDIPVLVQKPDGSYDSDINVKNTRNAKGIGPAGWNAAINEMLDEEVQK